MNNRIFSCILDENFVELRFTMYFAIVKQEYMYAIKYIYLEIDLRRYTSLSKYNFSKSGYIILIIKI